MIPAFLMQNLWLLYALAFAMSAVGTFFNPAKGALIPKMVPQEHLVAANALSQTSMMAAFMLGPALAGATLALVGNWIAFILDACTYLISALAIWRISMPKEDTQVSQQSLEDRPQTTGAALRQVWTEYVIGLKALALSKAIAVLALVFGITMLGVGALNVLWVAFLESGFGYSSETGELAWRFAVVDIAFFGGMVGASIVVGNFMSNRSPKDLILWGLIVGGATMVPLGYMPDYWGVVGLMFLTGLAIAPINTGSSTMMQILVPNEQLGRVGGGIGTVSETASIISMSLAGVLGAAWGIPVVFVLSGVLCILGGLLALVGLPHVGLKDHPAFEEGVATPFGEEASPAQAA
jgi:MFS family permease